jgi:hypothetical protein
MELYIINWNDELERGLQLYDSFLYCAKPVFNCHKIEYIFMKLEI